MIKGLSKSRFHCVFLITKSLLKLYLRLIRFLGLCDETKVTGKGNGPRYHSLNVAHKGLNTFLIIIFFFPDFKVLIVAYVIIDYSRNNIPY